MKGVRRQQREIDKARGRLFGWAEGSRDRADAISGVVDTLVARAAKRSGRAAFEVRAGLEHAPFDLATHLFAMLLWLGGEGETDRATTPLARYIAERAWRESPAGKRWLRLLHEARPELRDIVAVTPNATLRLGAPRGTGAPITVHEPRLANDVARGLVLYARVLPMPAGAVVADGLLMLSPRVVATLTPRPRAADVFAVWAIDALIAEGHLPSGPQGATREPPSGGSRPPPGNPEGATRVPSDTEAREKVLERVRKLFAMAQETEASPHEAEIALRRCQSLMAKFGISEKDLETSEFGRRTAHPGKRVPMHVQFLSIAVAKLHGVLFVAGGGQPAHFRGYEIDVHVARLTLDYLSDAVERALAARRRTGEFPPGRMAAYDYRLAFAEEIIERVETIVREREAEERATSSTGTALTVRKAEIVQRECGRDLVTSTVRGRGAIDDAAAGAGREDGSRVSLDRQVGHAEAPRRLKDR